MFPNRLSVSMSKINLNPTDLKNGLNIFGLQIWAHYLNECDLLQTIDNSLNLN